MLRAALYARYSSDLHRETSIEDQFRICRGHAERAGWSIVGTYHDAAISGDSVIMRPGMRSLLTDGRTDSFDVVVQHLFVLTLGFSRRSFFCAFPNERLSQFLDAHERAFEHLALNLKRMGELATC